MLTTKVEKQKDFGRERYCIVGKVLLLKVPNLDSIPQYHITFLQTPPGVSFEPRARALMGVTQKQSIKRGLISFL